MTFIKIYFKLYIYYSKNTCYLYCIVVLNNIRLFKYQTSTTKENIFVYSKYYTSMYDFKFVITSFLIFSLVLFEDLITSPNSIVTNLPDNIY